MSLPSLSTLAEPHSCPGRSVASAIQESEAAPGRPAADGRGELGFSGPASLTDAYRDHHGPVTAVARRVCGPDRANDVAQDVFIALWSHPERFDPTRGSLRSYLLVLAHHKAVDMVRSETSRLAREQRIDPAAALAPPKVEDRLLCDETAARVRSAVASLPAGEREAIISAFYEHRTYLATAQWLETPEGTIKSRIRSGLRRLHPLLAELGCDASTTRSSPVQMRDTSDLVTPA